MPACSFRCRHRPVARLPPVPRQDPRLPGARSRTDAHPHRRRKKPLPYRRQGPLPPAQTPQVQTRPRPPLEPLDPPPLCSLPSCPLTNPPPSAVSHTPLPPHSHRVLLPASDTLAGCPLPAIQRLLRPGCRHRAPGRPSELHGDSHHLAYPAAPPPPAVPRVTGRCGDRRGLHPRDRRAGFPRRHLERRRRGRAARASARRCAPAPGTGSSSATTRKGASLRSASRPSRRR